VEHLEREGIALPQVPLPLKLYVNELTPKPDGYHYPRNAWVQLNRQPNHLYTGVGRFKKPLQGTIVFFTILYTPSAVLLNVCMQKAIAI